MRTDAFSEPANLLDIFVAGFFFRQTTIGLDQTFGEIGRSVAHETFDVIENYPHLPARESRMIEKRNEGMDGLLKIDVVLPKCVVRINQEVTPHMLFSPYFSDASLSRTSFMSQTIENRRCPGGPACAIDQVGIPFFASIHCVEPTAVVDPRITSSSGTIL